MVVKPAQYAHALEALATEKPRHIASVVERFLKLLQKKGEMGQARRVIAALEEREAKQTGREHFIIETAHALDDKTKKTIERFLAQEFPQQKITVEYTLNEELIAGFRAISSETLIDESVRGKLAQLQHNMSNA
jgi:F0F1-type ATP synthase delta subunit